jgi:hypothetical protein
MTRLYLPVAVAATLIVAMTYLAWSNQDVFHSSSVDAQQFALRFKNVPKRVGPWVGEDREVSADTLSVAGAVGHVSRVYINEDTKKRVDLWLIVGHARDIVRHTPDICYPSQGFSMKGGTVKQRIDAPGEEPATFNTAKFNSESGFNSRMQRVFWAWNANKPDDHAWVAPDSQKMHFGNNTALYKMYFTTDIDSREEPIADSPAIAFGEAMIPAVNRALFPERYGEQPPAPESDSAAGENEETSESAEPAAETPADAK